MLTGVVFRVEIMRWPRDSCDSCHMRRVLYTIEIWNDDVARVNGPSLCAECIGIAAPSPNPTGSSARENENDPSPLFDSGPSDLGYSDIVSLLPEQVGWAADVEAAAADWRDMIPGESL